MQTKDAFSWEHLVLSNIGFSYVLLVEPNPLPEPVVIFSNYALRTSSVLSQCCFVILENGFYIRKSIVTSVITRARGLRDFEYEIKRLLKTNILFVIQKVIRILSRNITRYIKILI